MKQDRKIELEGEPGRRERTGRRLARAALVACAFAVSADAAEPGVSEELSVVGFNLNATRFAVVRVEPGAAKGKLELWDVVTNRLDTAADVEVALGPDRKPQIPTETLERLGLGKDRGTEQYKSGTRLGTEFVLDGEPIKVSLPTYGILRWERDREVHLTRGHCTRSFESPPGAEPTLQSVLTSARNVALAVIYKQREEGTRRYHIATTPIVFRDPAVTACLDSRSKVIAQLIGKDRKPALSGNCRSRLRQILGEYEPQRQNENSNADALSVREKKTGGFALDCDFGNNVGLREYDIVGCTAPNGALALNLRSLGWDDRGKPLIQFEEWVLETPAAGRVDVIRSGSDRAMDATDSYGRRALFE